ncbi:hypothetical protein [Rickettsia endosymbiont of Ceutorhynchus obstrictus]
MQRFYMLSGNDIRHFFRVMQQSLWSLAMTIPVTMQQRLELLI